MEVSTIHASDIYLLAYLISNPSPSEVQQEAKDKQGHVAKVCRENPQASALDILRLLSPWMDEALQELNSEEK